MATHQALAFAASSSSFLNPKATRSLPSLSACATRLSFARRRFKCSVEFGREYFGQSAAVEGGFPRPVEIEWKKELCNAVQLIGVVGVPVESKQLASGKVVAWTRLAVYKSSTDTSWINLTFWDELAQIATQHVQKGQQIHVSGRLISDTVESEDGKQQTYYKVVVQQLNFIEKSFASATPNEGNSDSMGQARKPLSNGGNGDETTEQLWQAFFANPSDWWDNRNNKRNPKYPDFKHKDTGEALWIEGRYNPPWVKSQLSILDTRMGSLNSQDTRTNAGLMPGDTYLNF